MSKPKVSVVSISYNQEAYIAQALESFVTQEVSFPFEVVICDDNSTDGTAAIIKKYAEKYPNIIKPRLRSKNIGIEANIVDALKSAKGEYIALCEGDDFWTDKEKLQRQVDFLDTHKDYSMVFHPVNVFFEDGEQDDLVYPEEKKGFTLKKLLRKNFIQTNSVMYRSGAGYGGDVLDMLPVDWYIHLYFAQFGKIGFINRTMSAYRKHHGGVWWSSSEDEAAFMKKIFRRHINFFSAVEDLYRGDEACRAVIYEAKEEFVKHAVSLNIDDELFLRESAEAAPRVFASIVSDLHCMISKADREKVRLTEELAVSKRENGDVLASRAYKLGTTVLGPVRRIKNTLRR